MTYFRTLGRLLLVDIVSFVVLAGLAFVLSRHGWHLAGGLLVILAIVINEVVACQIQRLQFNDEVKP